MGHPDASAERWQMIAAVPLTKNESGEWQGLNLTFYGFFSATANAFGVALMIVLLSSLGTALLAAAVVIATMMAICVPASKVLARAIEGKRNTFTIAGAAFLASLAMPPGLLLAQRGLAEWFDIKIYVMPVLAASAIVYALSEAIGRMACLSFGCCYGKPLRDAGPRVARLFEHYQLVFHGSTKKAAYASGLSEGRCPCAGNHLDRLHAGGTCGIGALPRRQLAACRNYSRADDMGMAGSVGDAARRSSRQPAHFDVPVDGPDRDGVHDPDADGDS